MSTFAQQLHKNQVAIISLFLAMSSLAYTAWRDERTEGNRTTRVATFEVLKNLGELQVLVNEAHYTRSSTDVRQIAGWGRISLITDLSETLPPPAREATQRLLQAWQDNLADLNTSEVAADAISREIDACREVMLSILRGLH